MKKRLTHDQMFDKFINDAEEIGHGRHRTVFLRKPRRTTKKRARKYVYKFLNDTSFGELRNGANVREARLYRKGGVNGRGNFIPPKDPQLAHCRLLRNGVLVMEYVEHWSVSNAKIPESVGGDNWDNNDDGEQCGKNAKGKVKVFDYAE